jgi:hypothetical protein
MQALGESEQHLAPASGAPPWIAVLGVGALGDDAVALAPAHQSAHAGCPADPGNEAHQVIVLVGRTLTSSTGTGELQSEEPDAERPQVAGHFARTGARWDET